METLTKKCRYCGTEKDLCEFPSSNKYQCKACRNAYKHEWYLANADREREKNRLYMRQRYAAKKQQVTELAA